ncbi:trimeric intracellular cation channel family protein [Metallosphaera tengchongensis]|uniref:Trimeric intracellular cation channel family protein n=1 Tax=Metallosphaera tengchongensis TaxID=1532350 RepID=A0A6N0NT80_9CREN|nr:trimeric intracellular cation channel family protein [Metallosphaera tengchongensis]QKQ99955.1 trimeric intracellular cation channel family protein [Metallosphaera tengchongensis]
MLNLLTVFNFLGIMAFSISGSLKAFEKKLDLLGVFVLGFSTALAGGIMRDVLLGVYPPTNISNVYYPIFALLGSAITIVFYSYIRNFNNALLIADAIGLGTFTATGAEIGLDHRLNIVGVALVASITAVGGGAVRDLLSNEIPIVLRRDFYATPTIIGGLIFPPLVSLLGIGPSTLSVFILVTTLRLIALFKKWELPKVGYRH